MFRRDTHQQTHTHSYQFLVGVHCTGVYCILLVESLAQQGFLSREHYTLYTLVNELQLTFLVAISKATIELN